MVVAKRDNPSCGLCIREVNKMKQILKFNLIYNNGQLKDWQGSMKLHRNSEIDFSNIEQGIKRMKNIIINKTVPDYVMLNHLYSNEYWTVLPDKENTWYYRNVVL